MRQCMYLFAAFALTTGATATAQTTDQEKFDARYAPWINGEALGMVEHLAMCTVERHHDAAEAFVLDVSDPNSFQNDLDRLMDSKCLKSYWFRSSQTSVTPFIYQPLLAQALLLQDDLKSALSAIGDVVGGNDRPRLPDVDISQIHPYYRDTFLLDRIAINLGEISECIARTQSTQIMALAATELGSAQERGALAEIDRNTADCGLTDGSVNFPTFVRRGALMLELYRLAHRAKVAGHMDPLDA